MKDYRPMGRLRLVRVLRPRDDSPAARNGVTAKVLCAWCVRDGRPAFLREKWPFDDPSETHGLCGDHFTSLSASVNQVVTPKVWFLSQVHDLCWGLIRYGQRMRGRLFSPLLTQGRSDDLGRQPSLSLRLAKFPRNKFSPCSIRCESGSLPSGVSLSIRPGSRFAKLVAGRIRTSTPLERPVAFGRSPPKPCWICCGEIGRFFSRADPRIDDVAQPVLLEGRNEPAQSADGALLPQQGRPRLASTDSGLFLVPSYLLQPGRVDRAVPL